MRNSSGGRKWSWRDQMSLRRPARGDGRFIGRRKRFLSHANVVELQPRSVGDGGATVVSHSWRLYQNSPREGSVFNRVARVLEGRRPRRAGAGGSIGAVTRRRAWGAGLLDPFGRLRKPVRMIAHHRADHASDVPPGIRVVADVRDVEPVKLQVAQARRAGLALHRQVELVHP